MKILLLLFSTIGFSQLINAPADCPIAYRLCDASINYNFQLVDAGLIDDAYGSLNLGSLYKSDINTNESRSAFLSFTSKYSGQFGLKICPEQNVEKLNFILYQSPNCADLETGIYSIIYQGTASINEPTLACTGIGQDPLDNFNSDFVSPLINILAGVPYMLHVRTAWITIPGNHRFNLTFQGSAVTDHPDLFDNVACQLATTISFVANNNITVFPNPFSESININSNIALEKTEIYDLLGKNVYSEQFSNEIETSFLQAGVYFIKLYSAENEVFVRKIVKK